VEVFSFSALEKTWREAVTVSDREHVTPFMRTGVFRTATVENKVTMSGMRLTVDEERDMSLIKTLMDFFAKRGKPDFGLKEITALWRTNPDFFSLVLLKQSD
jgi:spore coat polysaccharide biosynthesis protein SpsF (cytidylyltransferase family)